MTCINISAKLRTQIQNLHSAWSRFKSFRKQKPLDKESHNSNSQWEGLKYTAVSKVIPMLKKTLIVII